MKKLNKEEEFLLKLLTTCSHDDAYSVIEICAYFGTPYEQVKEWAATDERYVTMLDMCHDMCASNAEIAGLMGRMPIEEVLVICVQAGL